MTQPSFFPTWNAEPPRERKTDLVAPVERDRRESSKARILAHLEHHGSATNVELNAISFRYGGRLMELRKSGYIITSKAVTGGLWRYRLVGKKA